MRSNVPEAILKLWPANRWSGTTGVIAVSGGPDSVALLRAMHSSVASGQVASGTRLVVAHFNHRLRASESDLDEAFVVELAKNLGVDCVTDRRPLSPSETTTQTADPDAPLKNVPYRGNEAQWRKDRNRFFRQVALDYHATWIATGATADDQIETALHHLLRGSGPTGIAGVRFERTIAPGLVLVHPMMETWKDEIIEYLRTINQPHRRDASNDLLHFTRNRVRHELIPYMESFAGTPHLKKRLFVATQLIREEHALIESLAQQWLKAHPPTLLADGFHVPLDALLETPWPILQVSFVNLWHQLQWPLQDCTYRHWQLAKIQLQKATTTPHPVQWQFPGGVLWRCARKHLQVTRFANQSNANQLNANPSE
jgi:tRNA(Ile)-lysidine synthase